MHILHSHLGATLAIAALAEGPHSILVPLLVVCAIVIIAIPVAAFRGKLHMPGFAGLALLSLVVGWVLGRIAKHSPVGSTIAVVLSAIFFLLIATSIGSVLALACYRQSPAPESQTTGSKSSQAESKDAAQ